MYDLALFAWRRLNIKANMCIRCRGERTEVVWMKYDETGEKITQNLELIEALAGLPAQG